MNKYSLTNHINSENYKINLGLITNFKPLLGSEIENNKCILNYEPLLDYFIERYAILYRYLDIRKIHKFLSIEHVPVFAEAFLYIKKKYDQYGDNEIYDNITIPIYKGKQVDEYSNKKIKLFKNRYVFFNSKTNDDITNIKFEDKLYDLIIINKLYSPNPFNDGYDVFIEQQNMINQAIPYLDNNGILIFEVALIPNAPIFMNFLSYLKLFFEKIKLECLEDFGVYYVNIICIGYNNKKPESYNNNKYSDAKIEKKCNKMTKIILRQLEIIKDKIKIYDLYRTNYELFKKISKERYYKQLNSSIAKAYELDLEVKSEFIKTLVNYENKIMNKFDSFPKFYKYRFFIKTNLTKININNQTSSTYPILDNISEKLGIIMYDIESRDIKKWQYMTDQIDIFKTLHNYLDEKYNAGSNRHKTSNAFCKMYELLEEFNLINTQEGEQIKTFHICEAPGNFVYATNHYIKTKTNIETFDWYANSLNINNPKVKKEYPSAFGDYYGIINKYPKRWLFGQDNTGDITNMDNIKDFIKKIGEVDFLTGDCGLSIDQKMSNAQQNILGKINFAQIVILLSVLKNGGNFAIKHFMPMSNPFIVSYIYLLSRCFDELYLCKPICSRPSSREIYLVGKGYNKLDNKLMDKIYERFINFDNKIDLVSDIPRKFLAQYYEGIEELAEKQIESLNRSFYFYDNYKFFEKYKETLKHNRKTKNKNWIKVYNFDVITNEDKL